MKKKKIILLAVLLVIAICGIIFWPMAKRSLREVVIEQVAKKLHSEIKFGNLEISMFPPRVIIEDIDSRWSQGPLRFVGVRRATIEPGPGPTFLGKIVIKSVDIEAPTLLFDFSGGTRGEPTKKKKKFKLPMLHDLLRVEVQKVSVRNANLKVILPNDLSLDIGAEHFGFRARDKGEEWIWKGTGSLIRNDRYLTLDEVEIIALREGDQITLENISVNGLGSHLRVKGNAYPDLDVAFQMEGMLTPVEKALRELDVLHSELGLKGNISLKGQAKGAWQKLKWSGNLDVSNFELKDRKFPKIDVDFRATDQTLDHAHVEVKIGDSAVKADFQGIKLGRSGTFQITGNNIPYPEFQRMIAADVKPRLTGRFNAEASGEIQTKPFGVQGIYKGETAKLELELPPNVQPIIPLVFRNVQTEGKISWTMPRPFFIQGGTFRANGAHGKYEFEFDKGPRVKGTWLGTIDEFPALLHSSAPIEGSGQIAGGVEYANHHYGVTLNIDLDEPRIEKTHAQLLQTELFFEDKRTLIKQMRLVTEEGGITLNAEIPENKPAQISATLSDTDLGFVSELMGRRYLPLQTLRGKGSGAVEIGADGSGTFSLHAESLHWKQISFDELDLAAEVQGGEVTFKKGSVKRENSLISIKGAMGKGGYKGLELGLRHTPLQIAPVPPMVLRLVNQVDGAIKLDGPFSDPILNADLAFSYAQDESLEQEGKVTAQGPLSNVGWTLTWKEEGQAHGKMNLKDGGNFDGEGTFEKLSLARLFPKTTTELTGQWNLKGDFRTPESWNGHLSLQSFSLDRGDFALSIDRPTQIKIVQGRVSIPTTKFIGPSTELTMVGEMGAQGTLQGNASGTVGLGVMTLFLPTVARAEGVASVQTEISGTLKEPRYTGNVSWENGLLQFQNFSQPFESVDAKASLTQEKMVIHFINAQLGEGTVRAAGELVFPTLKDPTSIDLKGTFDRVTTRIPDFLPARWSGDLELKGPIARPKLFGNVLVHEATYRDEWDWKSRILSVGRQRIARAFRAEEERMEFDVVFESERDSIYIRNNIAEAVLRGNIRLLGSDQNPWVRGKIEVVSGQIKFLDNLFELTAGTIAFEGAGSNRPVFDLNAKTRVQETDIFLDVRTEKDEIIAYLSSQPPKEETSIIALLTLGVDLDSLQTAGTSGGAVSQAVLPSVLSGPFSSRLETGLKQARLVDSFQFVPYFSENTNTTGLKMVAGKAIFPSFRLEYSTDLFDIAGENTFKLNQLLNDHISLQGSIRDNVQESNEDYDLGMDVEFKFEF